MLPAPPSPFSGCCTSCRSRCWRRSAAAGPLLFRFAKKRRHRARQSGTLLSRARCRRARALARRHFAVLGRSMLERSLFWWASRERLNRIVQVTGDDRGGVAGSRPAGDAAGAAFRRARCRRVAVTMRFDIVSIYAEQSDPVFDRLLLAGRSRFGDQQLLSRADGPRATVKAMKAGRPFYYLPDMDFRTRMRFCPSSVSRPGRSPACRACRASPAPPSCRA